MGLSFYMSSTSNVLDLQQDLLTYLIHNYTFCDIVYRGLLMSCYICIMFFFKIFFFTTNSLALVFDMKYLNSAIFNLGFKFILLIALLVFVRGGIPRYRFDFLTKIG